MLLAAVGSKDDPASGGRQMPSHWCDRSLNIVSRLEPHRHAVPAGDRLRRGGPALRAGHGHPRPRGALRSRTRSPTCRSARARTSEGEFWESLNAACLTRLPVIFLVEDNGYAISVPVEVQTAGGDISKLVATFPDLLVRSIDGTDFPTCYRTMQEAVEYVRSRRGPAFVHAHVTRPYSHSLSDDERLYKTPEERAAEALRDPIVRLGELLTAAEGRQRRRAQGDRRRRRP